uniref:Ig-like domain-containing protein n=1 Tax=Podarcis muralis TaxID=64176 RepID=A0A670K278_PODMU
MAWFLSFIAFLSYFSGVISQAPMTQAASESVSVGQTIKLSCTPNGKVGYIAWYQQRPGLGPCFVHQNGQNRGEGIPDRFTASLSGNVGYLTITSTQAEDEAAYYCGTWYSSINAFHSAQI